MIYSQLSLSTGGGIVSEMQQAEQVKNTATVLIGLGGTGIDCLREIKKAVRERLKPDDPNALVPSYDHIRFLAVDTDLKNDSLGLFDSTEFFDISNPDIKGALKKKTVVESRRELDWLDTEKINTADIADAGAGGFRQAGRYMLMDRSNTFLDKVKELIKSAKMGAGAASVYVHVFSGLSGGTGSGCFLDACYLIRQAIAEEAGATAKLFGYFFLPDVNLAKIPPSASLVRDYVPKNGYAAMQELDYCMRLGQNGGTFTQIYKGGKQIDWKEAPVDMCHLISATDIKKIVVPNAYENAMMVTAEYVMDFLTEPDPSAAAKFGLLSHLSNFTAQLLAGDGNKEKGYNLGYCVIGASCASIPMREINTYLAAKTFEAFSVIKDHKPTENEIAKLAEKAKVSSINDLLIEITKNAGSDLAVAPDYLDWTFTRDNGDRDLVNWYADQKAERIGIQEKNAKSMQDEKNSGSLIARICEEIDACAVDLNRGPAYAYNTMRAAHKGNLQNIVDGLLDDLKTRISQLEYNVYTQTESRKAMYEQSRNIWQAEKNKSNLFGRPRKAYDAYVLDLEDYVRGQIELDGMEKLKDVLDTLKKQMDNRATGYYQKFNRIMDNLTDTFKENLSGLSDNGKAAGLYAMPLVTIDEIRPKLDETVKEMNMPGLFKQFVQGFFNTPEMWADEDEDKISKSVKKFFVKDAFSTFANRSITGFLSDKYNTTVESEITEHLYTDYMLKLKEHSQALFPVDASVWDTAMSSEIAYVSVPSTAPVVINAAQKLYKTDPMFDIKQSALTDRIYIMRCLAVIPIGSYANAEQYEQGYFEDAQEGRHYYVGKGGSNLFNNWNQLPSLIPLSCTGDHTPNRLQKILDASVSAYTAAKEMQLIYGDKIRQFAPETVQAIADTSAYAKTAETKAEANPAQAVLVLKDAKAKLENCIAEDSMKYVDTAYSLPKGSIATEKIEETIREDYFVASPAFHTLVRQDIERVQAVKELIRKIDAKIEELGTGNKAIKNFSQALFSGVIVWERLKVTYTKTEFGIPTEIALSDFMDKERFPYAILPLYQAYISYSNLDEDTKNEIAKEADAKVASFDDAFVASVKSYVAKFTPEFNANFVESAKATPEILKDATDLIRSLNMELNSLNATVKALGL